jgi:hypothetical protein
MKIVLLLPSPMHPGEKKRAEKLTIKAPNGIRHEEKKMQEKNRKFVPKAATLPFVHDQSS